MIMSRQYKFQVSLLPSLGLNDIKLGSSLYDVLNHLITKGYHLKFVFSAKDLIEVPYIVYIKELSIRLIFNGSNQFLQFIELNNFDNLNLTYKDTKIRSLSMKQIYNNSFGPTYPGEITSSNEIYILSYPGISFRFKIPQSIQKTEIQTNQNVDKNQVFVKLLEQDVELDTIAIHHERNWDDVFTKQIDLKEDAYILMDNKDISRRVGIDQHDKTEIIVDRVDIDMPNGKLLFRFLNHPDLIKNYEIGIGETYQQDVLATLGPPDDTFLKNDSRLTIHQKHSNGNGNKVNGNGINGSSGGSRQENEIFLNYFRYGIDILYDISSNKGSKIKKLIIHNNLPNSLNFQKYKKCIWRMIGFDNPLNGVSPLESRYNNTTDWKWINDKSLIATSEMYFDEIPKNFKKQGTNIPIILNRNDLINNLDQSIEFVSLDDDETTQQNGNGTQSPWGQSLIYAYKRCIWEIVDNAAINSVTLY